MRIFRVASAFLFFCAGVTAERGDWVGVAVMVLFGGYLIWEMP